MASLIVEFLDERIELRDGESLTFGRDARLVIDSHNQHLHRVLGSFVQHDGTWMIHNLGRFVTLVVTDGLTRTEIDPGGVVALLTGGFTVRFTAGDARYAISGLQMGPKATPAVGVSASDTTEVAQHRLNDEQRQLVVSLAAPLLSGCPGWPATMPTNQEVADALDWSVTKLNRKLDYLCSRMADAGVDGVQGDSRRRANSRRIRLAEYLVRNRVITAADLVLIGAEVPSDTGARDA